MYTDRESLLVSIRSYPRSLSDVYITRKPWVPEFLDIDAVLNMLVIPLELAAKKVSDYFEYYLDTARQASQERAVILEAIRDSVRTF
jgi:hypothetical protein